ncbi:DUF4387 domain-containing protein (plasmid) [Haloferax sp. S1W]|uniref:DUF4387 domain-containing protein n=1 Tax=Haloferax sp. S1W TaxID=3377110 RepID=UPI0037C9A943
MTTLRSLAQVIRSKNAGIHYVTIDIMFDSPATYQAVKESGALTTAVFADAYELSESDVRFFEYDPGLAFKVTIPRTQSAGSPGDSDIYGAQQYAPVLDIEVPI